VTWRNHSITRIATIPIILIVLAGLLLLLPEPRERVLDLFSVSDQTGAGDTHYTCPMHPDIRLGQMGDCPICGMSLVEKAGTDEEQTVTVTVTPQAAQLTGITVEPVQWRELHKEIDTYGTIDYDETRLGVVSAWVGGRIDRLFIDFTGVTINKGHPLVEMYSPELISSEREYVLALENLRRVRESDFGDAASNAEALVNSTRQRLLWMGLSEQQLWNLWLGSLFHDVGKLAIPDAILNKPGPLTLAEYEQMKRHPELGVQIVERISFLIPSARGILHHQERWDGSGYPAGLQGSEICIEGRILAVADAFDAMITDRPYRAARTEEEAVEELIRCAGSQFDPGVIGAFLRARAKGFPAELPRTQHPTVPAPPASAEGE